MTSGADTPPTAGAQTAADLVVRPISPDDKARLRAGFERLSDESRYRRFLAPHGRLSETELPYFTEVDHHDHEALVAIDPATGDGIGVARYVRSTKDPRSAEIALAVVDDWQGNGVGSRLAAALSDRAREEGIDVFTALLLADNQLMLNLAQELGEVETVHDEHGTLEIAIELPEEGPGLLTRLLRAVAAGDLLPLSAFQRSASPVSHRA